MATAVMMPCADAIFGNRFDLVDKKSKLGPVESSIHTSMFVANTDCDEATQSLLDLMTYGEKNITKQQVAECLRAGLQQGKTLEFMLRETSPDGCPPLLLAARKHETSALLGLVLRKADAN